MPAQTIGKDTHMTFSITKKFFSGIIISNVLFFYVNKFESTFDNAVNRSHRLAAG